jgi:hypothetical protein
MKKKDRKNKKTDALKQLFIALNAEIETGDGFTSYTLDSKNFKVTEFILSQLEIKGKKQ